VKAEYCEKASIFEIAVERLEGLELESDLTIGRQHWRAIRAEREYAWPILVREHCVVGLIGVYSSLRPARGGVAIPRSK
jgi:hypothetical protein